VWILLPAAHAQVGEHTTPSAEWLTAFSDVVVRATITQFAAKDHDPLVPGQGAILQRVTVSLKVETVLKGKPGKTITFQIDQPHGVKTLEKLQESHWPVLWFLAEKTEDEKKAKPADSEILAAWTAVNLGAGIPKQKLPKAVISMDLRVLDTEEALLAAVKAEVVRTGQKRDSWGVNLPITRELAEHTGRSGDANSLSAPALESKVGITIPADKKEYPFRSAIRLSVTYTNTTKEAVTIHGSGGIGDSIGIDLETYEVTLGKRRTAYMIHAVEPSVWKQKIESGKSWTRHLDLTAVLSATKDTTPLPDPFGKLGEYTVKLLRPTSVIVDSKPLFNGTVVSNEVKFTVQR